MAKKKSTISPCTIGQRSKQTVPLKRGDIVRILPVSMEEAEYWHCIAVVVHADPPDPNVHKGYPYQMQLMDHPYDDAIWLEHYQRIGNVVEAVHLLEMLKKKP